MFISELVKYTKEYYPDCRVMWHYDTGMYGLFVQREPETKPAVIQLTRKVLGCIGKESAVQCLQSLEGQVYS